MNRSNNSARHGIVYLRRSSEKSAESLENQLTWAIAKAKELGIELIASLDMLEKAKSLTHAKIGDIYVDKFQGAYMERPGFVEFHKRATDTKNNVTDCKFFSRDRFARAQMAEEAVLYEKQILLAGRRTVTSGLCCEPRAPGAMPGRRVDLRPHGGRVGARRRTRGALALPAAPAPDAPLPEARVLDADAPGAVGDMLRYCPSCGYELYRIKAALDDSVRHTALRRCPDCGLLLNGVQHAIAPDVQEIDPRHIDMLFSTLRTLPRALTGGGQNDE